MGSFVSKLNRTAKNVYYSTGNWRKRGKWRPPAAQHSLLPFTLLSFTGPAHFQIVQYLATKPINVALMQEIRESHKTRQDLRVHNRFSAVLQELVCSATKWNTMDQEAISYYTGKGYMTLNSSLRSQRPTPQALKMAFRIRRALSKLRTFQGRVWRGIGMDSSFLFQGLKEGDIFSDKTFSSSSASKETAVYLLGLRKSKYRYLFEIKSKTGVDVSSVSEYSNEKEVLFRPNTRFKIRKVSKKTDSVVYIDMDEII